MRAFGICERICHGKLRDKVTALCRNIGWVPHRINAVRPCCNVVFEIFADGVLTGLPKLVINSPICVVPKVAYRRHRPRATSQSLQRREQALAVQARLQSVAVYTFSYTRMVQKSSARLSSEM